MGETATRGRDRHPTGHQKKGKRQSYFKTDKVNGMHTLKAGGHTPLLGTSKSGRLDITEDSITGLRRHSVDMGASAPTYSSIKSEVLSQPARTVALDRRDSGRSHAARAGILGQYCVLLQARNHKKDEKRSGNTVNDHPRTLGLKAQRANRCVCL